MLFDIIRFKKHAMAKPFPYKIIDLTHGLSVDIPTWDGACGFNHRIHGDYDPASTYKFRTHKIAMNEGIGTHMDSPAHCFPDGRRIHELDLANLVAPCIVIDVSKKADEAYCLSVQDIEEFEKAHGPIPGGSFAIARTGWGKRWGDPGKYRNDLKFPAISKEAAALFIQRGVAGIGIDTLSPDRPDHGYPVHAAILGAGKYIVENIANAEALPFTGSYSAVLPLKIENGTEAPVRLIALLEN